MFEEENITTTTKKFTSNTPPKDSHIIEVDEDLHPAHDHDSEDCSDDSSTDCNVVEKGYTKLLEISDIQTSEEIPELSEKDVIPDSAPARTSSRHRKQITIFEDSPGT